MLVLLSPAKTLDFETPYPALAAPTQPVFLDEAQTLVENLRKFSAPRLARLMGVSDRLAVLNRTRYADWARPFTPENARPALFTFNGDVYDGLAARTLSPAQISFAQAHLLILSGLYGVLRPLDLMRAYRLEMSTPLVNRRGKDLYAFWGERLTDAVAAAATEAGAKQVVNLASHEYFKSIHVKKLALPVIEPVFEDFGGGRYRVVSFHAKRARGLMARFAIAGRLKQAGQLKTFSEAGYAYDEAASDEARWVFRRKSE